MGEKVILVLVLQALVLEIPVTHGQRSTQQYFHLTGVPYSTAQLPTTVPNTVSNLVSSCNQITSQPRPISELQTFTAVSLPSLKASQSQLAQPSEFSSPKPSNIDGRLLNNLAIALQMLILSNILNSTPLEIAKEKFESKTTEPPQPLPQNIINPSQFDHSPALSTYTLPQTAYSPPQTAYNPTQTAYSPPQSIHSPPLTSYSPSQNSCNLLQNSYSPPQNSDSPAQTAYSPPQTIHSSPPTSYSPSQNSYNFLQNSYSPPQNSYSPAQSPYFASQPEQLLPSAKLVGVPNFADPMLEQMVKRTRNNMDLMSPYEALAKSYSEPTPQYTPSFSRKDFRSPYAMIDTHMDFFPTDLF